MVNEGEKRDRSWDISESCLDPLVEVNESDDEIVVTADLPCVDKDEIEVRIEGDVLQLSANMRRDFQFESWGGIHRKVKFNSFKKSIDLPSEVDSSTAEASFKNGILKIRIEKRQGKEIEIK